MKKIVTITLVLLLIAGCDYDPILTAATKQTGKIHDMIAMVLIFLPILFLTIVSLWPHKKKCKH